MNTANVTRSADTSSGRAPGVAPANRSEAGAVCPVASNSPKFDLVTSQSCDVLEDAGCPLAGDVRRRLQFETLLTELSSEFVNVPASQVDSKIEWGLRRIVEFLGIDRSGLGQVSSESKQLIVSHSFQLPGIPPSSRLMLDSRFPTFARMIRQGRVIRLPDDIPPEAIQEREYLRQTGLKSNVTIPLMSKGIVVGGIGFSSFRSQRRLSDELIPRLRLLGDIFTNALARKRADEELIAKELKLRHAQDRLRRLANKLLDAQEEERRRVAREMHDDWAQRLAYLGIECAELETRLDSTSRDYSLLQSIREELGALSDDVHDLSRQLHPSILDDLGLVEALRSECAGFSRRTGILIEYAPILEEVKLRKDISLCIYRVAQEALRNIGKYAQVKEASLTLACTRSQLVLRVQDRGIGFDTESAAAKAGLGLSSMEERVRLIEGEFHMESSPGRGATVEVRVPFSEGHA